MKKLLFLPITLFVFFLTSCDKIDNPIVKKQTAVGNNFVSKNNSAVSNIKKTLLEDYTGQTCPNCPDAANTATMLLAQYPTNLIVVAVHAGHFAAPIGTYTNDFRTTSGNAWLKHYNITTWPTGMINRKVYSGTFVQISRTKWSAAVASAVQEPMVVQLDVTTKYDTVVRALNVEVKADFKTTYTASINYSALLVEDEIEGQQDYYGVEKHDYIFEHLMRGTIGENDIWGKPLKAAPIANAQTASVNYNDFPVDIKYNDRHLSVVVFAFNEATKEILQVEKVKIR